MLEAVVEALPADIAIFAAAVADWRAADEARAEDQEGRGRATLSVSPPIPTSSPQSPGSAANRPRLVIGFAAETEDLIANATAKRRAKGADWIVANDVSPGTGVIGGDATRVHLITAQGTEDWPAMAKDEVARRLLARAAEALPILRRAAE